VSKELNITLSPKDASKEEYFKPLVAKQLDMSENDISSLRIVRHSVDARSRNIKVNLNLQVFTNDELPGLPYVPFSYGDVKFKTPVIIIGAGPAGLFAALRLIELGYKPIILERGKDVSTRKRDVALITREHKINPDSNYCFGEGGAGTFSDGKLYTRSKKRGDNRKILNVLHFMGAHDSILYESHPHIGTDKLPGIIVNIREAIISAGGEVHFDHKVTDLLLKDGAIKGVALLNGDKVEGAAVIIATGHSARDIYELLHEKGILLEAKAFAMGVRVEHPQELIDSIQYHSKGRGDYLPAASYNLVEHVEDRGVYSFCMCPGGFIVPSATSGDEVVVNGMSPSLRNSPYANSGMVVEVKVGDTNEFSQHGVIAGLKYQKHLENLAHINAGSSQSAPAQRLADFVKGRISADLPKTSYFPGVVSSPLHFWLPEGIKSRLQKAFIKFGLVLNGYLTNEAVILGVETRTSSPLRIPRDIQTFEHPQVKGLFPCGEGSGYAGGIVSSAVDGELCAEAVANWLK
jgi:uncharacterized protein